MRTIIQNNFRHWRLFPRGITLFLLAGLGGEVLFLTTGPLGGQIIDMIVAKADRSSITGLILLLGGMGIIGEGLDRLSWTTKDYVQSKLRGNLQCIYYAQLLKKDYPWLASIGTGNIQSKMEKGIDAEVTMFIDILHAIVAIGFRGTIIIGIFFVYLPWLNVLFVFFGMIVLGIHRLLLPRIKIKQDQLSQIGDDASTQTTKIAMEYHTIRLHTKESKEIDRLQTIWKDHPSLSRQMDLLNETGFLIMGIGFKILNALGYVIMGISVINLDMTIGTMIMILGYINWMWRPLSTMLQQMSNRRKNIVRRKRMHDVLNKDNLISNGTEKLITPIKTIIFDTVFFGYHTDKYVLLDHDDESQKNTNEQKIVKQKVIDQPVHTLLFEGLSLTIPAGKTTAFVGRSGSGKTSIVKLLLRLYDPDQGSIMIGNQDLRTLDRNDRYDNIGYLSQEPGIFDGTVRENLMYGITTNHEKIVSDDELRQSLDYACIGDRVRQFDKGLDEALGEKGIKLSGGEKQRLAIARLFLRQPEIIIMDEPSAALDSESEHTITESLKKLFANKTTIIIAHRLQTVMHADQIIVMEQGKIIEQGTHSSLVAQGGNYSQLINLQNGTIGE